MESLTLMISIATFLICLILSIPTTTATATATNFIRASCMDTSYPSMCYKTLSPHAHCINKNHALLAKTAVSISLKKSKAIAVYLTHLNKTSTLKTDDLAPVLDDCVSTLTDAVDLARDSVKKMKEIVSLNVNNGAKDEFVMFKIGDVQTWLSAALSNQVTCIDGFEEVDNGLVKANVIKRVNLAKMATSNALALIDKFVNV